MFECSEAHGWLLEVKPFFEDAVDSVGLVHPVDLMVGALRQPHESRCSRCVWLLLLESHEFLLLHKLGEAAEFGQGLFLGAPLAAFLTNQRP